MSWLLGPRAYSMIKALKSILTYHRLFPQWNHVSSGESIDQLTKPECVKLLRSEVQHLWAKDCVLLNMSLAETLNVSLILCHVRKFRKSSRNKLTVHFKVFINWCVHYAAAISAQTQTQTVYCCKTFTRITENIFKSLMTIRQQARMS